VRRAAIAAVVLMVVSVVAPAGAAAGPGPGSPGARVGMTELGVWTSPPTVTSVR
jgi:hypothetical protein